MHATSLLSACWGPRCQRPRKRCGRGGGVAGEPPSNQVCCSQEILREHNKPTALRGRGLRVMMRKGAKINRPRANAQTQTHTNCNPQAHALNQYLGGPRASESAKKRIIKQSLGASLCRHDSNQSTSVFHPGCRSDDVPRDAHWAGGWHTEGV